MSSVEFEDSEINYHTIDISRAVTHNTPLIVKYGIIKDLKRANITMLVVAILLVLGSVAVFTFDFSPREIKYREDYSPSELDQMLPDMIYSLPTKPQ
jgi:hypothetical protein